MTIMEKEALECLTQVMRYFTGNLKVSHREFLDLMTVVRDTVKNLENRKYGCISGKHAGTCTCSMKQKETI